MPRKQRFKPSRKPKPISTTQTLEDAEVQRPSMQRDDAMRALDEDRATSAGEGRAPEYQDRLEAR
jgi:hypothetical protein